MLTPYQQKEVWERMLASEVRANYFADLSQHFAKRQKLSTWCTLILSSSAAGAVIADMPPGWSWVKGTLATLAAAISGYSLVMQNQKITVDSSDLHSRWNRLGNEYRRLWGNMHREDAEAALDGLVKTEEELSKSGVALPYKKKLLAKWEDRVIADHEQERCTP